MKRIISVLCLVGALIVVVGCTGGSTGAGEIAYERVEESNLPAEVRQWVKSVVSGTETVQTLSKSFGEKTYLLVYAGMRPTGGYSITFGRVTEANGAVSVQATITAPDGVATQALTYPFAVARIDGKKTDVSFTVTEQK